MRNFGECPNVAEESGLWQILQENAPLKYYLSAKDCRGILRRAEKRGKILPKILKLALEQQIERLEKYGSPLPYSVKNLQDTACYDARENGDGKICPTVTGDHNNRITDYTAVVCQKYAANSPENGIAGTIDMHYYLGCGARNANEREFVVFSIDRASFNQGENAKYGMSISDDGIAQTVVAKGPGAVCYNQKGEENPQYIVRRLTPLECGRLQGMPDFWCRDIPHSDANEYKMYGNGMALPNALYVMEGFMK